MKYAQYHPWGFKLLIWDFLLGDGLVPPDRSMVVDFNAVTLSEEGKFETLIDFMMRESAKYKDRNDAISKQTDYFIKVLRSRGVDAKMFSELPQSEQDKRIIELLRSRGFDEKMLSELPQSERDKYKQ